MMESLKSAIINDSVIQKFLNPSNPIKCQTPSITIIPILLSLFFQCSLLHPNLVNNQSLSWIRFFLTPINVWLSLKIPIDFCFQPFERNGIFNFFFSCFGFHFLFKSFEWGLMNDQDQISKLHLNRDEFNLDEEEEEKKKKKKKKKVMNEIQEKKDDDVDDDEFEEKRRDDLNLFQISFKSWYMWTVDQFLSARGFQYGWGSRVEPNRRSAMEVFKRLIKIHFVHVLTVSYSVYLRDMGSPIKVLNSIGLPNLFIFRILLESISTFSFGIYIVTLTDLAYTYYTLFAYLIFHLFPSLPDWLKISYNLKLFVPLYFSPHLPTSLNDLWSLRWHQLFRRSFIFCGGIPFSNLFKFLGFNKQFQKIAGLFGCFLISGLMHELAIHFTARPSHSNPHHQLFTNSSEFPGSFVYFLLQPFGMILESMILNHIPFPTAWVYLFTLISATPFRLQYFSQNRLLDQAYPPLADWNLISFLIPLGMIKFR